MTSIASDFNVLSSQLQQIFILRSSLIVFSFLKLQEDDAFSLAKFFESTERTNEESEKIENIQITPQSIDDTLKCSTQPMNYTDSNYSQPLDLTIKQCTPMSTDTGFYDDSGLTPSYAPSATPVQIVGEDNNWNTWNPNANNWSTGNRNANDYQTNGSYHENMPYCDYRTNDYLKASSIWDR